MGFGIAQDCRLAKSLTPRAQSQELLPSTREVTGEMLDDVARIVFGAVDEGGLAAAEHRQSDRVQPRRIDDAAVVAQVAFVIDDRHVEPAVVGTKSGRPQRPTGSRRSRRSSVERRRRPARASARSARAGRRRIAAPWLRRPLIERVEQPFHLQIGERELIAQAAGEQRPAVAHRREPADDLDAGGARAC